MTVDRRTKPFPDRGLEPDSPHMGTNDEQFAAQVESMVFRLSSTCRSWNYPNPGRLDSSSFPIATNKCPIANVVAVNTWYDFKATPSVSYRVEFPWRYDEGSSYISVQATLACEYDVMLQFRCKTGPIVAAVAETLGESWHPKQLSAEPTMALWKQQSQVTDRMFRFGRFVSEIINPTLPEASRRIVLIPQVKVTQGAYDLFGVSGSVYVGIADMQATNMSRAVGGGSVGG